MSEKLKAEIERLQDEADYWQQKIDEGKVEIERLRATLRYRTLALQAIADNEHPTALAYRVIAREALNEGE